MSKHEPCDEQIVLRLPASLRDQIEEAAAAEGRSVANMARRILERAMQREQAAA